jgi:hypothetical protein
LVNEITQFLGELRFAFFGRMRSNLHGDGAEVLIITGVVTPY